MNANNLQAGRGKSRHELMLTWGILAGLVLCALMFLSGASRQGAGSVPSEFAMAPAASSQPAASDDAETDLSSWIDEGTGQLLAMHAQVGSRGVLLMEAGTDATPAPSATGNGAR